jgi:hypothetical protein
MSLWQLAQELVRWTEAASAAGSAKSETTRPAALVVVIVLSLWQSRQSLLLISAAAKTAVPASAEARAITHGRHRRRAPMKTPGTRAARVFANWMLMAGA